MKKVLFVTSEAYPLIKTGGLADVSGSLPIALDALGQDVRILMPGYPQATEAGDFKTLRVLLESGGIAILEGWLPGSEVPVWLITHDEFFGRGGNPYLAADGRPWADNPERFALLCHVAVEIAMDRMGLAWKPDVVHCNDWQTGLIPALLSDEPQRPATVFTIHNLAYQGVFPHETFQKLRLPSRFWSPDALEFYGQFSFIKGGLVFADRISTVSPTYAREIQGEEFGCGLQGLLSHRSDRLSGIINGIDAEAWNPAIDPYLPVNYDRHSLAQRSLNKSALQERFGLAVDPEVPVLAWVGRLVQQKGIDLVIDLLPRLMELNLNLVLVGSGEARYESMLTKWAKLYPDRIAIRLGYDEPSAHLIEAGADLFLMPSRFEPCGLNQMYSQRYGAVPLVRRVGGLADTVEDADDANLAAGRATGIRFDRADSGSLLRAIERGLALFREPATWQAMQGTGMAKDFSWETSAQCYLDLYDLALADCFQAEGLLRLAAAGH